MIVASRSPVARSRTRSPPTASSPPAAAAPAWARPNWKRNPRPPPNAIPTPLPASIRVLSAISHEARNSLWSSRSELKRRPKRKVLLSDSFVSWNSPRSRRTGSLQRNARHQHFRPNPSELPQKQRTVVRHGSELPQLLDDRQKGPSPVGAPWSCNFSAISFAPTKVAQSKASSKQVRQPSASSIKLLWPQIRDGRRPS